MNFKMAWDDDGETVIRVDISGAIGFLDYIVPMNDAGGWALLADGRIDVIVDMGMTIPFPARPFRCVRDALMGSPRNLQSIVIVSSNPLTRLVTTLMLLNPYPELKIKVQIVTSTNAARTLIARQRGAA